MKTLMTIIALSILTPGLQAQEKINEKFFCALPNALKYKGQVVAMRGTDKTRHCAISCILTLECGQFETYLFGLSKEIYDAFGGGTPDSQDIVANKAGIKLAVTNIAQGPDACMQECQSIYPAP